MKTFTKITLEGKNIEYQYIFYSDSKEKIIALYSQIQNQHKLEIVSIQLNV